MFMNFEENRINGDCFYWYIDRGATDHYNNDESVFETFVELETSVTIHGAKDDFLLFGTKKGNFKAQIKVRNSYRCCTFSN